MASHRKLRAAAVVCAAVAVAGPASAAAWAAPPTAVRAAAQEAAPVAPAAAPSPSPDPFADLTPDEIGDRAITATQSATSLRMAGRVTADGQPLDIDFAVNERDECTGLMKIGGGTAELRRIDGITYMKGDEAFWRVSMASQGMSEPQIGATIELVKGRWLKISPGQAGSSDLSGVCDLEGLLASLDEDRAEPGALVRGPDGEVDGTPVATLVKRETAEETTGEEPTGTATAEPEATEPEVTTVSVSQEGKPYILKMVKTGGEEPGSMTLSDFDEPVEVAVPPASETVDLSKLDQGTSA